ncbi:hypothetical protein WJX72_008067 [[Myrmecia] bisecta]|uniref:Porin n=1 Tax=[Myrmecia] bisecta TaxID=41462 RepID=A0AAW1QRP0_9CHLO
MGLGGNTPAFLGGKGFLSVNDITSNTGRSAAKVGGRVDLAKEIGEINFVLSLTDATIKGYEAAPWLKDAILTAEKKINSNVTLGLGYDAGAKNAFASVTGETNVSNKDVVGRATWFQKGNAVRTEGVINLDSRNSIWGTYTFNDNSNMLNSTFVNLTERNGFVIDPFTIPVSTAAAKYSYERDGYLVEPAVDFKRQAPYLSVQKNYKGNTLKAQYAFQEETALFEVGFNPARLGNDAPLKGKVEETVKGSKWAGRFHNNLGGTVPLAKVYAKSRIGPGGAGPLSVGFILDKTIEL